MSMQRHVRLTRNASGDTISIPPEFALSSDDVVISKDGDRLIIEPETARNRRVNEALLAWLATQAPLPPEDAMDRVSRGGPTRPVTHLTVFLLDTNAISDLMQTPVRPGRPGDCGTAGCRNRDQPDRGGRTPVWRRPQGVAPAAKRRRGDPEAGPGRQS